MLEDGAPRVGASALRVVAEPIEPPWSSQALQAEKIERVIARLETQGLDEVRAAWRERYGAPPQLRSPELLRLMLAWRLQAALWGGLDATIRRSLKPRSVGDRPKDGLPLGARVAREWRGEVHEVTLVVDGYLWRGQTYSSLSAVARAMTGVRWNGPRFFGLRNSGGPS